MNRLPHKVIVDIVSRLDPLDCVELIQVSRQWRHIVPSCAALPFQDITVDEDSFQILSHIHVFGRFVRTARVKLHVFGAMIKALDRLKSCSLLQKLELRDANITLPYALQAQLISCFKHWSRLDTFAIINLISPQVNLVDFILLASEYNVHHIACISNGPYLFQVQEWLLQSSNLSTLVSLVLVLPGLATSTIKTLLSYTPNIEYLELGPTSETSIFGYGYMLGYGNSLDYENIDQEKCSNHKEDTFPSTIITLCPKITHLQLHHDDATLDDIMYPRDYLQFPIKTAVSDDQDVYPGLRCYCTGVSPFDQSKYDMLLRHQSTLEHVNVGYFVSPAFRPDWDTFTTCFLPNTTLKHLVLPSIHPHADWLKACHALEHLELRVCNTTFGASMRHTLEYQLPSLGRIDLTFHTGSRFASKRIVNQLKLLRALRYRCNHTDTLKELNIDIYGVSRSDIATILSAVLAIHSLEKLTIQASVNHGADEQGVLEFMQGLQYSLPYLRHLRLGESFFTFTANVIHALAALYRLDSLTIFENEITVDQAELLISTMGDYLDNLYLVKCGLEEDDGIECFAEDYPVECLILD